MKRIVLVVLMAALGWAAARTLTAATMFRVVTVTAQGAFIDAGREDGVREGLTGRIGFIDQYQGAGGDMIFIAWFHVTMVEHDRSEIVLEERTENVQPGYLVRFEEDLVPRPAAPARPAYEGEAAPGVSSRADAARGDSGSEPAAARTYGSPTGPANPELDKLPLFRLFGLADEYYSQGDYEKARDHYGAILRRLPDDKTATRGYVNCVKALLDRELSGTAPSGSSSAGAAYEAVEPAVSSGSAGSGGGPADTGAGSASESPAADAGGFASGPADYAGTGFAGAGFAGAPGGAPSGTLDFGGSGVPDGWFVMGTNGSDGEADEKPAHRVYVDRFVMDPREVTNAEFARFCEATKRPLPPAPEWDRNYMPGNPDHPVIDVTWFEADAYCRFLGKRLPTEAEWEKAARGGVEAWNYPWGEAFDCRKGNFDDETEYSPKRIPGSGPCDGHPETARTGSFDANGFGLYDLTGNVWEWCLDSYAELFYQAKDERNPRGPSSGAIGVIRGGSWKSESASSYRASNRGSSPKSRRSDDIGFRCVLAP